MKLVFDINAHLSGKNTLCKPGVELVSLILGALREIFTKLTYVINQQDLSGFKN